MKKWILIIIGFSFLISCNRPDCKPKYRDFENDWELDNVFGKVKTLEQFRANVTDFETEATEKPIIDFKKKYNRVGRIIFAEYFDDFGKPVQFVENRYSNNGSQMKSIAENHVTKIKTESITKFNDKGERISISSVFNDSIEIQIKYEYDKKGNIIKQKSVRNGDKALTTFDYKFNDNGKIVRKIKREQRDFGLIEYVTNFEYSPQGKLIARINKSEFANFKKTFEYSPKDRIEKVVDYQEGIKNKATLYDNCFNPILIKYFQGNELIKEMKYNYRFDKVGNWIKRKALIKEKIGENSKFKSVFIETRKIEYYK
jgi:hypothetical protein